jgi:hypothetical protein
MFYRSQAQKSQKRKTSTKEMTDVITSSECELEEDLEASDILKISSKEKVKQKKGNGISKPLYKEDVYAFICILLLSSICLKNYISKLIKINTLISSKANIMVLKMNGVKMKAVGIVFIPND